MTCTFRVLPDVKRSPQPLSPHSPTPNSFSRPPFLDPSSHLWINKDNSNKKAGLWTRPGSGSPPAAAEATQVLGETTHPRHLGTTRPGCGLHGGRQGRSGARLPQGRRARERNTSFLLRHPAGRRSPAATPHPLTSPSPNEVPKRPPGPGSRTRFPAAAPLLRRPAPARPARSPAPAPHVPPRAPRPLSGRPLPAPRGASGVTVARGGDGRERGGSADAGGDGREGEAGGRG